jgi:NADH dehydrogenase FAD-containing subunit
MNCVVLYIHEFACRCLQVTPLTKEHSTEVSDLFDPAKASSSSAAAKQSPSSSSNSTTISNLLPVPHIYALGDCCANTDSPLPPLAQVAEQQGKYLASILNAEARNLNPTLGEGGGAQGSGSGGELQPFKYRHLGSMATVGGTSAIIQLGGADSFKIGARRGLSIAGVLYCYFVCRYPGGCMYFILFVVANEDR